MTIIEKEDYIFDVDIEKTKEYYATITLCDCNECQNYYRQAENTFPKLTSFLLDFGIDIARPDEICSIYNKGEVAYLAVAYTVVGECVKCGEYAKHWKNIRKSSGRLSPLIEKRCGRPLCWR